MNVVDENHVNAKPPVQTKRPYAAPILSEYGDIRQITQSHQAGQTVDGAMGSSNMTLP
jgi:hypothetical protein